MNPRWMVAIALVAANGGAAVAQPYPSRSIRMIIPAGPGGGVDTVARIVGQPLGAALGQPMVMDNRPGAGTVLASELTAKAPPDGHTLLMATNSHAINAAIHKDLRYDPVNDFAMVTMVASVPYWLVVHPSVPVKSVKELIALAKRRPGELYFAPADIVGRLNREIVAILRTGEAKDKLASQGAEVLAGTPAEFVTVLRNDIRKWAKVTAGMKL